MEEIIFLVEESPEGGYIAQGLGVSIFTQADSIGELKLMVNDAIKCHYGDASLQSSIIFPNHSN